eukprot:jgi/Botrbrau1/20261/Bobra.31_1s0046.1
MVVSLIHHTYTIKIHTSRKPAFAHPPYPTNSKTGTRNLQICLYGRGIPYLIARQPGCMPDEGVVKYSDHIRAVKMLMVAPTGCFDDSNKVPLDVLVC